jgi:hypothetical protein
MFFTDVFLQESKVSNKIATMQGSVEKQVIMVEQV